MKKERPQKDRAQPKPPESVKDKFRLIKNENYQERPKPQQRIKIVVDDLPPAA